MVTYHSFSCAVLSLVLLLVSYYSLLVPLFFSCHFFSRATAFLVLDSSDLP